MLFLNSGLPNRRFFRHIDVCSLILEDPAIKFADAQVQA
jgi:hypothetical protein